MANVDKAFGLRPLGNLSATGSQKQYGYEIEDNQSGAIYQGDLVTIVNGYVVKFVPATHSAALGVFNGCFYVDPTTGKPRFTPLVGLSLMVFFVLAMQCMSTVATVKRETNSWRWPLFQIAYMNALAYSFDPHTAYLSPRKSEDFSIDMNLSLEGIGAAL